MLADLERAPIGEKPKAMLRFLRKLTLDPGAIGAEDARALKAIGISRSAAEDAILVAFCFNQITRMADALGWYVPDRAGFDASARSLLEQGYLMPLRPKRGR